MLRKFAYNKIFRTTGMLLLLMLLLLFPASKEYSLEDDNKVVKASNTIEKKKCFYSIRMVMLQGAKLH